MGSSKCLHFLGMKVLANILLLANKLLFTRMSCKRINNCRNFVKLHEICVKWNKKIQEWMQSKIPNQPEERCCIVERLVVPGAEHNKRS